MSVSKRTRPANGAYYSSYKAKYASHRRARISRHLKEHPEDTVAKKALETAGNYRRKTPKGKHPFKTIHQTLADPKLFERNATLVRAYFKAKAKDIRKTARGVKQLPFNPLKYLRELG